MKREEILQIVLICLLLIALFTLSSCGTSHQACAAYAYHEFDDKWDKMYVIGFLVLI